MQYFFKRLLFSDATVEDGHADWVLYTFLLNNLLPIQSLLTTDLEVVLYWTCLAIYHKAALIVNETIQRQMYRGNKMYICFVM